MTPTKQSYAELQRAYDFFNRKLFDGILPDCLLTLQRERRTYGYFSPKRFTNTQGHIVDEIALNPLLFNPDNLTSFFQTLVHEMCHLWQHHHGKAGRGRYHNAQWSDKMESIGLMPSDTGKEGGKRTGERMGDYILEGGLLEKAIAVFLKDDFILWRDRMVDILQEGIPTPLDAAEDEITKPPVEVEGFEEGRRPPSVRSLVPTTSKPTRAKYSCPSCQLNVWAKFNVQLICGACEEDFICQDHKEEEEMTR